MSPASKHLERIRQLERQIRELNHAEAALRRGVAELRERLRLCQEAALPPEDGDIEE